LARRAHEFLPKRSRRRQAVRWHVSDTDKATVCGVACKCVKADREGYIFQSLVDDKVNFPFTVEAYEALLDGQEFDLEPNGLSLEKAEARLKSGISSARELRGAQQMLVDLREIAVWKFQELYADDRASKFRATADQTIEKEIQPYVDREARKLSKDGLITTIKIPGAKEFLKWVKNYQKLGKLALIPGWHRCGHRAQRYTGDELALVMKQANRFLSPERPTREIIYKDLVKEIAGLNTDRRTKGQKDLRVPDEDFLNLQIERLAPFDVDAARHLDEHAKRRFHPSKGGVPGLFRPMQRVEVDDWDVHLHVLAIEAGLWQSISPELQAEAEKTRCVLSAAICCVTRVLPAIALSFEPSAANTAMLLRMCMSDKTPLAQSIGCETPYEYRGNPFILAGDEGTAILNARTKSICDILDVEYLCPQIETPQQRPKIERSFQTIEIRSLLRFSGRSFSDPKMRGKYEAQARACVTVAELAALILRFIVDEYHNTPHAGLDGETPRHCWLRLTRKFAPRSVPGKPLMRRAFGEPYKITLQPEGIEIFGNWYTSPTVDKLFRERPEREYVVIVDSEDLGGVSLRVDEGWLDISGPRCMNGISVAVWDMARASMRREHKHIEKIVEPVVHRAIGFAQMADAESRKRLGIRYRPKTPEELEKLRNSIGRAVRFAADPNPRPARPVDIFVRGIAVGTKAPARTPLPPPPAEPKSAGRRGQRKTSRTPRVKPQPVTNTLGRKPPRQWKPKERK
jgi:putative transposase